MKAYYSNTVLLFLVFSIFSILIIYIYNNLLDINNFLFTNQIEQLSAEKINTIIENKKKWAWLSYIFIPIVFLIKWCFVTTPLYIGAILFNKELSFKQIFSTVIFAEIVFLFLGLTKIIWLFFHKDGLTFEYFSSFTPLSLLNFFDIKYINKIFIYPLQTLNLFELVYWFLLAHLLSKELGFSFGKSLEFVLSTYVVGLFVWIIFVTFLTLNIM